MQGNDPDASPSKLEAQIAALQAQLARAQADKAVKTSLKRDAAPVLIAGSPSPKRRKVEVDDAPRQFIKKNKVKTEPELLAPQVAVWKSTLLNNLTTQQQALKRAQDRKHAGKSTSFTQPATSKFAGKEDGYELEVDGTAQRDDSLALIEKLEPGPREFKQDPTDPNWHKLEPYSRIRLRSRITSHEDVQDYMHARYYLPVSTLYSVVRPGRNNDLDVPIDGDFVLIGVLAEKSDIRITNIPQSQATKKPTRKKAQVEVKEKQDLPKNAQDDQELQGLTDDEEPVAEDETQSWTAQRKPKRYVIFKLLDLTIKRGTSTSSGDSYLSVILFESNTTSTTFDASDESDTEVSKTGIRKQKEKKNIRKHESFRGGSGGAYEKFWKEADGTVVAILNPKVMKPRQQYGKPVNNVLTVTPESAESIIVIGKAQDLGKCPATKKDNTVCGSWYDKRIQEACDYHVAAALQKTKSGRSELMVGTSSLTSNIGGRNGAFLKGQGRGASSHFDPSTKTGLLPRDNKSLIQGAATYVVGGSRPKFKPAPGFASRSGRYHDVVGGFAAPSQERDKADRQKKAAAKEAEEAYLMNILQRDDGKSVGAKYLAKNLNIKSQEEQIPKKRVFSAASLRAIGFDPTSQALRDEDEETKKKRLETVTLLDSGITKNIKLGPAPGCEKKRSNVIHPSYKLPAKVEQRDAEDSGHESDPGIVGRPESDDDGLVIMRETT